VARCSGSGVTAESGMPKRDKLIFITLFFSIFATISGVGIVVPLLPVYARTLGAGGLYIGLIFGAFTLSRTIFLPYFGQLSDKKGRKTLIVPGLLAYTIVSIAFLISESIGSLILIRLIQGVASAMLMPVIQAYVGDITPAGREGFTMGLFNMSVFFGLSLGPVLGGLIHDRFGLDAAFWAMGGLSLIGFFLSLFLLPPVCSERVVRRAREPTGWQQLMRNRELAGLFFFRLAYTACIGIIWGFLPVLADAELALSSTSTGFLVMLGIFVSGIIQLPMGYVADRLNKKLMVILGGALISGAILSYFWADKIEEMVLASVMFGIGGGICMPALMATAVLVGEKNEAMGSVMALLTVAHSMGMLAGSMLAGLMMDLFRLRAAFPLGAALMILGIAAFAYATRQRQKPPTGVTPAQMA
jgi:MFS transporter, DHA1 family, multidrug resistance protein